ncbi:MAG: hypothetical protein K8S25_17645 [Alphaproteobacteria bacterium]|nr:hypothetical protein [Alphaproteobacteria bacterium]
MTDAVQMPSSMPVVPRVAPVRPAEHIEPPKKTQADNQSSKDSRGDSRDAARSEAAMRAAERQLRIAHDDATQGFVYRSVEADTGEVVWQWPSEDILRRAQFRQQMEEKVRHEVDEKV